MFNNKPCSVINYATPFKTTLDDVLDRIANVSST